MTTKPKSSLHRRDDPETSIAAAESILPKLGKLQWAVLDAMRRLHMRNGRRGCTAREVAEHCWEHDLARHNGKRRSENSFRRRVTELAELGLIESANSTRDRSEIWIPLSESQFREKVERQREGSLF